ARTMPRHITHANKSLRSSERAACDISVHTADGAAPKSSRGTRPSASFAGLSAFCRRTVGTLPGAKGYNRRNPATGPFDKHTQPGGTIMHRRQALALLATGFGWFALGGSADAGQNNGGQSPVGMWHAVLQLGKDGPVYDEIIEHFHSDGTELLISNSLPPAVGNICIGVWKRVGSRTFRLKHMTWNWSGEMNEAFGVPGTHTGHFELELNFRLDERGKTYRGTWLAKNYDLAGNHIPELDAEGVVRGTRITAD